MPASVGIAVVAGPAIGGRFELPAWIVFLGGHNAAGQNSENGAFQYVHGVFLAERLEIRHQVMNIVVAIFCEQFSMGGGGLFDIEPYGARGP